MTYHLNPDQQRIINLAIQTGTFHNADDVIDTALALLLEDIEDGAISTARATEPRSTLAQVKKELRKLGKLE